MMVIAGNPRTGTPEANMSAWEASVEASLYGTMRRKFDDDGEEQFDVDEFDFDDEDEDLDDDDSEDKERKRTTTRTRTTRKRMTTTSRLTTRIATADGPTSIAGKPQRPIGMCRWGAAALGARHPMPSLHGPQRCESDVLRDGVGHE